MYPVKLNTRLTAAFASLLVAFLFTGCEWGSSEDLSYSVDGIETYSAPAPAPAPAPPSQASAQKTPSSSGSTTIATPSNVPAGIGTPGRKGGFVWKPVSESDGKLVVLLPTSYKGNVSMCYITDANGGFIESGRFVGDTHNGNRPHFRFSKPGAQYGNNLYIVAVNNDGSLHHWFIPNGGGRTDY